MSVQRSSQEATNRADSSAAARCSADVQPEKDVFAAVADTTSALAANPESSLCKLAHTEQADTSLAAAGCDDGSRMTSTSLDADDEADAEPPADTPELASTPSSVPAYPGTHRWIVESEERDSSPHSVGAAPDDADAVSTHHHAEDVLLRPLKAAQSAERDSAPASQPPVLRRRPSRRGVRSNSSPHRRCRTSGSSSSDATPTSSPIILRSSRVSLSQAPSTFSLAVGNAEGVPSGSASATAHPSASAPQIAALENGDGKTAHNLSSSPPASPPSLATAASAPDFSSVRPDLHHPAVLRSPVSTHLRLAPHSGAELQQFGCCVFFFPAPLVSWLFPLIGHVAISNAEGSRLFTFESSYYVREEKLVTVLNRVLREEMGIAGTASGSASPTRRGFFGLERAARSRDVSDRALSPSPAQSPLPFRGSAMSDASTSDPGMNSPSDVSAGSPAQQSVTTPLFPPRASARPPRRSGRSRSAATAAATGHTHTRCVRIWDLKPLLMESRGRRTRRAPYSITREGGKQAALALWERLQELLQPTDGPAASGVGGGAEPAATPDSSLSHSATRVNGRVKTDLNDETDGARSAPGMSSSSGDDDDEYELLDAETAHFFNRNLNATIRLFRGSADGSNNSPDVVLQHHSSFSFVGFVLEACGVGSQAKPSTAAPLKAAPAGAPTSTGATGKNCDNVEKKSCADGVAAGGGPAPGAAAVAESAESEDEIHWGPVKLLLHVFIFGKWHRGEGRLRRALHGGSITSAAILWVIILAVCFHYFSLLFS